MKRHLLLGMVVGTAALLSIASLLNQDPFHSPTAPTLMAVACGVLGGAIWVVLTAIIGLIRHEQLSSWAVWRQAALWSIVISVLLYLQSIRSLTAVESGLVLLAAVLLELFFKSEKTDARQLTSPTHHDHLRS